ncbi:MAG: hypothetical protein ACUVTP_05570 [Candidatus Fervidibacter sp.]|uniref:hypothetical protein n=1 Tax=Candidatus Fervidibacter sp. TaxID=3100871 RepID=UPI0040494A06
MGFGANTLLFAALLFLNVILVIALVWRLLKVKNQPDEANLTARFLTAVALSTVIGLSTLPSKSPFQPSHSFGIGILSSAIGASIVFWLGIVKMRASLGYLGVFAPLTISLTILSGSPFPSLLGLMVGTVIVWFCLKDVWSPYGLIVLPLIAATGLARFHEQPAWLSKQIWQSFPFFLTVSGWLGVGILASWRHYWQKTVNGLISNAIASVTLFLGSAFISYWSGDWRFTAVVILTCIAALIVLEAQRNQLSDFAVLIWVGLLILSFATISETKGLRLFGGYGVSLAAVTLSWLALSQDDEQTMLERGAAILTTFALFRLFAEFYPLRAPRADLYTHYTFVGFLLGTSVPALLSKWMVQGRRFVRELSIGFWAAAIPVVIAAIWGVKSVVGYLAGSIAASLLITTFNLPALFAGFAAALPLTALVEPASDLPRKVRLWIVAAVALIFVLNLAFDRFAQSRSKKPIFGEQ